MLADLSNAGPFTRGSHLSDHLYYLICIAKGWGGEVRWPLDFSDPGVYPCHSHMWGHRVALHPLQTLTDGAKKWLLRGGTSHNSETTHARKPQKIIKNSLSKRNEPILHFSAFHTFYNRAAKSKINNQDKQWEKGSSQKLHFWVHFGTILGPFLGCFGAILGRCWDHFGVILVPFWALLGPLWAHFGAFWDHFVTIVETFWALLKPIWGTFGTLWCHFVADLWPFGGVFVTILGWPWGQFGSFWDCFGAILGPFWCHVVHFRHIFSPHFAAYFGVILVG